MTPSRRKTPVCGITKAESEKRDKLLHNRAFRRKERQATDPDEMPQKGCEVTNVWSMGKDGKHRFDPTKWPDGMRK